MGDVFEGVDKYKKQSNGAVGAGEPLRYRIREGSGGEGLARSGGGIEREEQVLEDCTGR